MTAKQIIHTAGLVAAAILTTLSQLNDVLPAPWLRTASGVLGVLVALFTNLDRVLPAKGAVPTQLLLLLVLPLLHGCAFLQKPSTQHVVRCTAAVLNACKADVMPTITACLAAPADPTPCLLALLNTGGCVTTEALACKTRESVAVPVAAAFMSAPDEGRRAEQAERFFAKVGVVPVAP